MKNRLIVALCLAMVASLAFSGVSVASSATKPKAKSFSLLERRHDEIFVDLPPLATRPGETSPGDKAVFATPLFDLSNTTQLATAYGECTQVSAARSPNQCVISIELTDGVITMQGVIDFSETESSVAITGGTGRYRGASGQVNGTNTPDGLTTRLNFLL